MAIANALGAGAPVGYAWRRRREDLGASYMTRSAARPLGVAAGLAAFALIALVPGPLHRIEGFGHRPAYAAAVAALMAIWWFTEAVPITWTACVPVVLFPMVGMFGGGPARDLLRSTEPF